MNKSTIPGAEVLKVMSLAVPKIHDQNLTVLKSAADAIEHSADSTSESTDDEQVYTQYCQQY